MTAKKLWALESTLAVLVACGDDATGPAVMRNDPGTGTRTMLVQAEIEGQDVSGGSSPGSRSSCATRRAPRFPARR